MNEEEVRSQLETLVRREFEFSLAKQLKREEELEHLSDEEWWNATKLDTSNPVFDELRERIKDDLIARRHDRLKELRDPALLVGMVNSRVEQILPYLLQVRQASGESGPVTLEQYDSATQNRVSADLAESDKLFEASIVQEQVGWKREFKSQFLENMREDKKDIARLQNPDVTEEDLQDVTAKIVERMNKLTEQLRTQMPKPPSEDNLN